MAKSLSLKEQQLQNQAQLKKLDRQLQELNQNEKRIASGKSIMVTQLKGSQQSLMDLQKRILRTNQDIMKLQLAKVQKQKDRQQIDKREGDRNFRQVSKRLKQQLKELAMKRLPLLPTDQTSIDEIKNKSQQLMIINSVKIRYYPHIKDGDGKELKSKKFFQVSLRILDSTTFQHLKNFACKYWGLEKHIYSLRAYNFSFVQHLQSKKVIQIFKEQKLLPILWLIQSNNEATEVYTGAQDYFLDQNQKQQFAKTTQKQNLRQLGEQEKRNNYKQFRRNYLGLQAYMPQNPQIDENSQKKRLGQWDVQCPTLVITALALYLTIFAYMTILNSQQAFWTAFRFRDSLNDEWTDGKSYQKMSSITDVESWMVNVLGPFFFDSLIYDEDGDIYSQNTGITHYMVTVGPLRIRTMRTEETECAEDIFDISGVTCYEGEYSAQTRDENPLVQDGVQDWMLFSTAEENDISSLIFGEFSIYDGSGYVRDFSLENSSDDTALEEFQVEVQRMIDLGWLDRSTRAIVVNSLLYSPTKQYWVWLQVLIENSITGVLRPYNIVARILKPDLVGTTDGILMTLSYAFRILAMFYLIFMNVYSTLKEVSQRKCLLIWKLVSFRMILDLTIVVLLFLGISLMSTLDLDGGQAIKENKFIDMDDISKFFRMIHITNSCIMFLFLMKLLTCLKINRRLYLLLYNIEIASKDILTYMLLLLPLLIGFCFLSLSVWGPYYTYYRNFQFALLNNLLFTIGIGNTAILSKLNLFWTVMFYLIYLFFVVFFVLSAFIGIFMDAYRQMRIHQGHRDELAVLGVVDYMVWILGFLPRNKIRHKIEEMIQERRIRKEQKKREANEQALIEKKKKKKEHEKGRV